MRIKFNNMFSKLIVKHSSIILCKINWRNLGINLKYLEIRIKSNYKKLSRPLHNYEQKLKEENIKRKQSKLNRKIKLYK